MWFLLLSFQALAQSDLELERIRKLEKETRTNDYLSTEEDFERRPSPPKHRPPYRKVTLKQILSSGTEHGHVMAGRNLVRISDNQPLKLTESFFGKFYKLEDEFGFRYIQSNDGSCLYKIKTSHFNSVEEDLALYEPPLKYTPAPTHITRADYDKEFKVLPEATFLAGFVQGNYMRDLFNDEKARTGVTTQYGAHFATEWKLPVKVGAVVHYEKSSYALQGGGRVVYSSPSFGPQFKTKDFDFLGYNLRLQTQIRVSPFANASAVTQTGNTSFKFNSTDWLLSAEYPLKNTWGHFVVGLYVQTQWLNLKEQSEIVSIKASNQVNRSAGLSVAQVFE
jgi:hypothetical protein